MSKLIIRTFLLVLALCAQVRAGGACSQFAGGAELILKQNPALHAMVTSTYVIEEDGFLGPLEQKVLADGSLGMEFTYHEFTATDRAGKVHYVIRIHFKPQQADPQQGNSYYNKKLDRLEIIPTDAKPEAAALKS